jgi:hypothetical protein
MNGLSEIEEGRVKVIHHSTSSSIQMIVKNEDHLEDGTIEEIECNIWFDYDSFKDLKKLISNLSEKEIVKPSIESVNLLETLDENQLEFIRKHAKEKLPTVNDVWFMATDKDQETFFKWYESQFWGISRITD